MNQQAHENAPVLRGTSFAVPAAVVAPHLSKIEACGISSCRRIISVDHYKLDAFVFEGADADTATALLMDVMCILGKDAFDSRFIEVCRAGRRQMPYFCGVQGTITIVPMPAEKAEKDIDDVEEEEGMGDPQDRERYYYRRMRTILERMSRLAGGVAVTLHPEDRKHTYLPLPDVPGAINLYTWGVPPGDADDYYLLRAFEKLIDKDGKGLLTWRGVPGRGELVGDGKHDLVQMLGSNWYVLYPFFEFANSHTTEFIMERTLGVALARWQALNRGARRRHGAQPLSREQFATRVGVWVAAVPVILDQEIQRLRNEIESKRRELASIERRQADLIRTRRAIDTDGAVRVIAESLPEQWQRIRANRHVHTLEMVGKGVHVTTKPIVLEREGMRYPVGRFVLRFNEKGVLTIWGLDAFHPKGIPHPHINIAGHPCFGNASAAIEMAIAEHRYADAVDYLTRWLADGYEEALALHPITEWPAEVLCA